jgi:hypothetical protein
MNKRGDILPNLVKAIGPVRAAAPLRPRHGQQRNDALILIRARHGLTTSFLRQSEQHGIAQPRHHVGDAEHRARQYQRATNMIAEKASDLIRNKA